MPENVETRKPTGYPWPGADEMEVAASCTRVARHLARAGVRSIGVLSMVGNPRVRGRQGARTAFRPMVLAPLLERLAAAMAAFSGATSGFIGPLTDWQTRVGPGGAPSLHVRELRSQVLEILPPKAGEGKAAVMALEHTLATLPAHMTKILVDLTGWAPPGRVPDVARVLDGVVVAVASRRSRQGWVAEQIANLPEGKNLGVILIG